MDATAATLELKLLPGARALLQAHARDLPQRDDQCGAFCGALALSAAEIDEHDGEPADQDAVARAAGTVVSRIPDVSVLPHGEAGRRDYRIAPALIDDASVSGTNCAGVLQGIELVSGGRLAAIPYSGPWTAATLDALFDAVAGLAHPATLIANVATRHLWGARPAVGGLLSYLLDGADAGPDPDWDVGHFVCVFARTSGRGGALFGVADTYRSLGRDGVHVQPRERLAVALERPGMTPGGMIAVVAREDGDAVRAALVTSGLREGAWDNGSPSAAAQV